VPILRELFGERFDEVVTVAGSAEEAVGVIAARSADVAKWASTAVDRKLRQ
jgi:hypothetical protein